MSAKVGGASRVTIYDVARLAGVGTGTVSRVLNKSPNVSEATRRRVAAAVDQLGFWPDAMARALRSRRTGTIGAIVPFFTKHFYVEILRAIARATTASGLSLVVFDVERPEERERVLREGVLGGIAAGLLIVSLVPSDREIERLAANGLSAVLLDAGRAGLSGVEIDHERGSCLATRHLIRLGHSRIAHIGRPSDPFASGLGQWTEGYRRAVSEADLPADETLLIPGNYSRESGRQGMATLLKLPDRPSAVFAASDLQAIGAMEIIRDAGLRVPEDVAVVGYNDIELAEYTGLTTIRLPTTTIGEEGVRLLRETLAGARVSPGRVRVQGELVVRRTCGAYLRRAGPGAQIVAPTE